MKKDEETPSSGSFKIPDIMLPFFYNYEEIDYSGWVVRDLWKIHEGISLILGFAPYIDVVDLYDYRNHTRRMREKYRHAIRLQDPDTILRYIDEDLATGKFPLAKPGTEWVTPSEFIFWAMSKGLVIPEELKSLANEKQTKSGVPLNPKSSGLFTFEDVRSWHQVTLTFVNEQMIEITTASNRYNKGYEELGFRGYGDDSPSVRWDFLKAFASHGGILKIDYLPASLNGRKNIKKDISDIRKDLKKIFPNIEAESIEWDKGLRAYRTKFKLSAKTEKIDR